LQIRTAVPGTRAGRGMVEVNDAPPPALDAMRRFLADQKLSLNLRLPPERELCKHFGVSRSELRKALAVLESEGQIWRHVGRGTFIGSRPVLNISDVEYLSGQTSPAEVMEARLAFEPQMARLAAIHATRANFTELRNCSRSCRAAREWRTYEAWDDKFHRAIAAATRNKLLVGLFDTLAAVRRSTTWGQLRSTRLPPADHASFLEHEAIVDAIARRDPDLAADRMRRHLGTVRDRILASLNS
jgi:GntR family uxuAB operon transcriptional repressor